MEKKESPVNLRKNPRIGKKYCVKYYIKGEDNKQCDISQIKDISQGGIRFLASKLFSKGERLQLELHVPYTDEGIKMDAEVVACQEKVERIIYEVRLKFINVSEDIKVVLGFIEKRYYQEVK